MCGTKVIPIAVCSFVTFCRIKKRQFAFYSTNLPKWFRQSSKFQIRIRITTTMTASHTQHLLKIKSGECYLQFLRTDVIPVLAMLTKIVYNWCFEGKWTKCFDLSPIIHCKDSQYYMRNTVDLWGGKEVKLLSL